MKGRAKHHLSDKVKWIRKNWPFVEVANDFDGGYLVISIGIRETGGQGRVFTQSCIDECIDYIKKKNAPTKGVQLELFAND